MIILILLVGVGLSSVMAVAWWFQRRWRNAGWTDVIRFPHSFARAGRVAGSSG
jgi:hypothetical protein